MNILIIGSGGREHAFAWKLKQSPRCGHLFIAPGNAGTALLGTNLPIGVSDFENLAQACVEHQIALVLVGPEEPLVKGIYDYFKKTDAVKHIHVIGPSQTAAQLEGSKAFAKGFMKRHQIPTASYKKFTVDNYIEGAEYIKAHPLPIVLKVDGLAAGKGVVICENVIEALAEFELMLLRSKFGEAGKKVVVEEFLTGIEISVFALTDGKNYVLLPEAKDYKRIGEKDTGLNTGGMGAISPVPFADEAFMQKIKAEIIEPTIRGLQAEQMEYKGFVFFGLINDNGNAKVIEYNCRMGDPETEVVIPRLKNDFLELLLATAEQRLDQVQIEIDPRVAATVMAVSGGYPGEFMKGIPIKGLEEKAIEDSFVFHSGTMVEEDRVVTNGGRVLTITSLGDTINEAVEQSNYMMEQIFFAGMYSRGDIGYEFRK
ncbi:MAG: phosphoribosylamine--glycine ligase [Chitinophagaceae bacterium]